MPGLSPQRTEMAATCIRCGTVFTCNPSGIGTCWCMEKPLRPMPTEAAGCYCPACFDLTEPGTSGTADAAAL